MYTSSIPRHLMGTCIIASLSAVTSLCAAYMISTAPDPSLERLILACALFASGLMFCFSIVIMVILLNTWGRVPDPDDGLPIETETTPCDARSRSFHRYTS